MDKDNAAFVHWKGAVEGAGREVAEGVGREVAEGVGREGAEGVGSAIAVLQGCIRVQRRRRRGRGWRWVGFCAFILQV